MNYGKSVRRANRDKSGRFKVFVQENLLGNPKRGEQDQDQSEGL